MSLVISSLRFQSLQLTGRITFLGIYAEAPIWVTTDPVYSESANYPSVPHQETAHLEESFIKNTVPSINGTVIPLAPSAEPFAPNSGSVEEVKWFPSVMGAHSEKGRPTWKAERLAAF